LARINAGNIGHNTIYVNGYQNVVRSFARVSKSASRNLNKRLKEAAEPVRETAQEFGPSRIRNLHFGDDWSRVRTGATQRVVYIAPVERGRNKNPKKKRPNFKNLMLDRAYEPALDLNRTEVLDRLGGIFDDIQEAWRA
jgi:hypothetical protein